MQKRSHEAFVVLRAGFFKAWQGLPSGVCVGVRKHDLRTPVTVLVSLDRVIP